MNVNLCSLIVIHLTSNFFVLCNYRFYVHLLFDLFPIEIVHVCALLRSVESLQNVRHLASIVLLFNILGVFLVNSKIFFVAVAITMI